MNQSGEDRICSTIRNLMQDNELEQRQKSIDSKVALNPNVDSKAVLSLLVAAWKYLPRHIQEEIATLISKECPMADVDWQ